VVGAGGVLAEFQRDVVVKADFRAAVGREIEIDEIPIQRIVAVVAVESEVVKISMVFGDDVFQIEIVERPAGFGLDAGHFRIVVGVVFDRFDIIVQFVNRGVDQALLGFHLDGAQRIALRPSFVEKLPRDLRAVEHDGKIAEVIGHDQDVFIVDIPLEFKPSKIPIGFGAACHRLDRGNGKGSDAHPQNYDQRQRKSKYFFHVCSSIYLFRVSVPERCALHPYFSIAGILLHHRNPLSRFYLETF